MNVSIDGATQQTYQIYRVGGHLTRVIENIKRINLYKHRYNHDSPELIWHFLLFGHNENELPKAREMAEDLGMQFKTNLNGNPDYSPIKDTVQAVAESGYKSWNDQVEKTGLIRNHSCYQLWKRPVINWDGKLLGCARNRYGHFGDVFAVGLGKCMRSKIMSYTKKMLMGKAPPHSDIPCISCRIFDMMRSKNIYVQPYRNTTLKRRWLMRLCECSTNAHDS